MAIQTVPPLPLPKHWPQRVRSAAVHAIALARLALTTARGQADSADLGSGRIARLTEEGPAALVPMREPVNRFPDFVAHVVRKLKVLCPTMRKLRIAQLLARAGLHLGSTTVVRMLTAPARPRPAKQDSPHRAVRSTRPNQIWKVDLTIVPTAGGFWVPWVP